MSDKSARRDIGLVVLSVVMLTFSFLFNERGESTYSTMLLFGGIIFALLFAALLFIKE